MSLHPHWRKRKMVKSKWCHKSLQSKEKNYFMTPPLFPPPPWLTLICCNTSRTWNSVKHETRGKKFRLRSLVLSPAAGSCDSRSRSAHSVVRRCGYCCLQHGLSSLKVHSHLIACRPHDVIIVVPPPLHALTRSIHYRGVGSIAV